MAKKDGGSLALFRYAQRDAVGGDVVIFECKIPGSSGRLRTRDLTWQEARPCGRPRPDEISARNRWYRRVPFQSDF